MEAVFLKLVNMSITASYLVLAVLLLRVLLKKAPKNLHVALWGLVGLRLVFPFSIESVLSLIPSAQPLPEEFLYAATPQLQSGIPFVNDAVNPVIAGSLTPVEPASANPTQIWSFIFSHIWMIGVILMAVYAVISYLMVRWKVRVSMKVDKQLYLCDHIDTPFILGILKPRIYLPSELDQITADHVLAHENAHLKRRDHWWKPLGFGILSVYWFNPVMWLAYILLCRDIEMACDEKVIRDLGTAEKKAYSEALLQCSVPRRMITVCPLAFGEVDVKNRIKSVLNYKKPAFWIIVIAVIACIIVAVCFLTDPLVTIDPMTLEDWGITITATDVSSTGVTLVFDIPDNLDGNISIPLNQSLLQLKDGEWVEMLPVVSDDSNQSLISSDAGQQRLSWELTYGALEPGEYQIRKTLWLFQDGLGYHKDFYVNFSIESENPYQSSQGSTPSITYHETNMVSSYNETTGVIYDTRSILDDAIRNAILLNNPGAVSLTAVPFEDHVILSELVGCGAESSDGSPVGFSEVCVLSLVTSCTPGEDGTPKEVQRTIIPAVISFDNYADGSYVLTDYQQYSGTVDPSASVETFFEGETLLETGTVEDFLTELTTSCEKQAAAYFDNTLANTIHSNSGRAKMEILEASFYENAVSIGVKITFPEDVPAEEDFQTLYPQTITLLCGNSSTPVASDSISTNIEDESTNTVYYRFHFDLTREEWTGDNYLLTVGDFCYGRNSDPALEDTFAVSWTVDSLGEAKHFAYKDDTVVLNVFMSEIFLKVEAIWTDYADADELREAVKFLDKAGNEIPFPLDSGSSGFGGSVISIDVHPRSPWGAENVETVLIGDYTLELAE